MPQAVWYAAYGSNLSPERFASYLFGGTPPGGRRAHPGCRTPPARMPAPRPLSVPGAVHFAGVSRVWGGGMAFFDPDRDGTALLAAYPLDLAAFLDVAAQEMHLAPEEAGDPDVVDPDDLEPGRSLMLRQGRYGTVHVVGRIGGAPVLTLSHGSFEPGPAAPPTDGYLGWIIRGLRTVHALEASRIADHLARAPGIGRSAGELAALVRATPADRSDEHPAR